MPIDFDSLSQFEKQELEKIASDSYYLEKDFQLSEVFGFKAPVVWLFLALSDKRPMYEFTLHLAGDGLKPSEYPFIDLLDALPVRYLL